MTSQWCHRNKTHSWYSEWNFVRNVYFGLLVFGKLTAWSGFVTYLSNEPRISYSIPLCSSTVTLWQGEEGRGNSPPPLNLACQKCSSTTTKSGNPTCGADLGARSQIYIYKYLDTRLPSLSLAIGDPFKLTSPAQHASRWRMRGSQTCRVLHRPCGLARMRHRENRRDREFMLGNSRMKLPHAMHAG